MKKQKIFTTAILSLALLPGLAQAALVCSEDRIPVDGGATYAIFETKGVETSLSIFQFGASMRGGGRYSEEKIPSMLCHFGQKLLELRCVSDQSASGGPIQVVSLQKVGRSYFGVKIDTVVHRIDGEKRESQRLVGKQSSGLFEVGLQCKEMAGEALAELKKYIAQYEEYKK